MLKFKPYRRTITTVIFILLFFISIIDLIMSKKELVNKNGINALREIVFSMFNPNLSPLILKIGISAVFETLAYAAMGISIAVVIGFLIAIPSSEIFKKSKGKFNIAKHILSFMRGIHEIIWAWFFVASIGMTPFSGVLAIAIPYAGTLGKIFSDILRDTPKKPIESLVKSGASTFQQIIYGIIPQNLNQLKSYIFYRFECAIRSSAVLSFIGLGGLGYQINISLQDLKYNEVWTFIYILVLVVIMVDFMGKLSRSDSDGKSRSYSNKILISIVVFSWMYFILFKNLSLLDLFTKENLKYSNEFLKGLAGLNSSKSPYTDFSIWANIFKLTLDTLQMSIIAIGISTFGMLCTIFFSIKKNKKDKFIIKYIYHIVNYIYIFTRTVPELIWAVLFVFIFKPGILPGAIALGIHNFGILGKLCSELVEDYDDTPTKNLYKSGATKFQAFIYSTKPNLYPRFVSYILYRFEVIVRTSIVVGIVGAGGLGELFKLSMSYFHYGEVGIIIIAYIIMVSLTDYVSVKLQNFNR